MFFVVAVVDVLVPAVVLAFVLAVVLVVGLPVQLQVVVIGDELAVACSEHLDVVVVLVVADAVLGPDHRFAHKNVLFDDEEHLLGEHHGIEHESVE